MGKQHQSTAGRGAPVASTTLPITAILVALAILPGCGRLARSSAAGDSVDAAARLERMPTLQVARVDPSLKGQRYSVLLNFEIDADDAFVTSDNPGAVAVDANRAMTGERSLRIEPGRQRIGLKLASLLSGRAFPADWTLIGASFYADAPAELAGTLRFADGSTLRRVQPLEAGQWSAAWFDLSTLAPGAAPDSIEYELNSPGRLWMDDLLMTDNTAWLVGESAESEPWSVHRRGYTLVVQSPRKFRVTLDTQQGKPTGWAVEEAGPGRAVFSSRAGDRTLAIYPDGRSYWGGAFRPLSPQAREEPPQQHASPAAIAVPETMGRVNRRSPGDENNDGYNETLGAYQITATGPRVDVTISPRSAPLYRPMLEIAGLPPDGRVLVTVEGRLVETFHRTPGGHLLVSLPFRIDRTTTVNVRVG